MCDFSGRLVAWLDHELPADDAAEIEWHLEDCAQCRGQVDAYKRLSSSLEAYCDAYWEAATASMPRRKLPRWVPAFSGAAAVVAVAAAALFLLPPRARRQQSPVRSALPAAHPAIVSQKVQVAQAAHTPALAKTVPRHNRRKGAEQMRLAATRLHPEDVNSPPPEPAVEIAIPAEAIFPPGAIPAGVSFTGDITIAPDGSAQQIRLRPQLAGFERRPTHP